MVYGAEFGLVVLTEGPRRVPVQLGLDHFVSHHPHLECERHVWSVVMEFLLVLLIHASKPHASFG